MCADIDRVDMLFEAALELPHEERCAFLDQQCGTENHLRIEVDRLLDAHRAAGPRFLEGPGVDVRSNVPSSNPPRLP